MPRPRRQADLTETLQRLGVPSAIVDPDGVITWQNDAATEQFGDNEGRRFFATIAPEDVPRARRALERLLTGVPAAEFEVDVATRNGDRRRVEISSVPIPGGDRWYAVFGVALVRDPPSALAPHPDLTPRQNEVLQLLAEGFSTDQIAGELHVSRETVRNHVRHLLRALRVHSRLEAVAAARRRGAKN